jgi:hypothetical protein
MRRTFFFFVISYLLLVAGCFLVTELPGIPYNVIELFTKHSIFVSVFLFAAVLIWSFGIPVFLGFLLTQHKKSHFFIFPLWIVAHSTITWILLSSAVPTESIYDIVGSPVLGWPFNIETFFRFISLFSVPSISLVGITTLSLEFSALKGRKPHGSIIWTNWFIVLLAISYLIVVVGAATDNLTELIAGGGSFLGFFFLCGWMLISFIPGSYFGGVMANVFGRWSRAVLIFIAGLIIGFVFVYFGLEHNVYKYGKTFSALQFLLSPTRDSLVSNASLIMRYVALETALLGVVCISQYPFWKLINERLRKSQTKLLHTS